MKHACGIVLATLALHASAVGQDLPSAVSLQEVSASGIATLTFVCDRVDDETASCTYVNVFVSKPSPAGIERKVAELDTPAARKALSRELQQCKKAFGADKPTSELTGPQKRFYELVREPCAKQDLNAFLAALKAYTLEIEANTCTVETYHPKTDVFKRKSANVWQSIDDVSLGGTVIMTIWREPKGHWSFRVVRAGDTNCKPDGLLCRKPTVAEWRWDQQAPTIECRYTKSG